MPDLEIKIRTILEGQGIKVTDDQLKSLAASTQGAGSAARDASGSIEQFGKRGSEASDAFQGLSRVAQGGEGAIFGLAKAWRALTVAFAANPVTATLAVLLGLLPLLQKGFDLFVSSAEKARDKLFGTSERATKLADDFKLLQEASEKSIKAATEDAQALAAAYQKAVSAVEDALRRFKEVEQARAKAESAGLEVERQKALAGAGSPEAAAAINARFDQTDARNKDKSASKINDRELIAVTLKADQAAAKKFAAERAINEADTAAAVAQKRLEDVQAANKAARAAPGTRQFEDEIRNVVNARNQADKAREFAKITREKNQPAIDESGKIIADADARTAALTFENRARVSSAEARTISTAISSAKPAEIGGRRAELARRAEEQQASGDFAGQGTTVAEIKQLDASLRGLTKALKETLPAVSASLDGATKDTLKLKMQIRNKREG